MSSSIIHDNICSLIHKKRHPKSYHSDINYHITLNIIFSIAIHLNLGIDKKISNEQIMLCWFHWDATCQPTQIRGTHKQPHPTQAFYMKANWEKSPRWITATIHRKRSKNGLVITPVLSCEKENLKIMKLRNQFRVHTTIVGHTNKLVQYVTKMSDKSLVMRLWCWRYEERRNCKACLNI